MEQMQIYFDIDGVAVYAGADMHRMDCVGKYVNPIENLTCMQDPAYQEYFDDQGFYIEDANITDDAQSIRNLMNMNYDIKR